MNTITKTQYKILKKLGFSQKSLIEYRENKLAIALLTVSIAGLTGMAFNGFLATLLLVFQLALMIIINSFLKSQKNIDELKEEEQAHLTNFQKEENQKIWKFRSFKRRSLFYILIFIFWTSLFVFFNYSTVNNTVQLVAISSLMSIIITLIIVAISEYTFGGLHRHKKLNYFLIALFVITAILRLI